MSNKQHISMEEVFDTVKESFSSYKETINTVENIFDVVAHGKAGYQYRTSKQYREDCRKAERIDRFSFGLAWFFIVLWIIILIATVVLCITGNDTVLRFLSL